MGNRGEKARIVASGYQQSPLGRIASLPSIPAVRKNIKTSPYLVWNRTQNLKH